MSYDPVRDKPIFMNPRFFSGFSHPPLPNDAFRGNPEFGPGFTSPFSAGPGNDPDPMTNQAIMQIQQHIAAINNLQQQLVNTVRSQVVKISYLNQKIVDLSSELAKVHNENISLKILSKTTTKKRNKATSKPFVHGAVPGLTVEEVNIIIDLFKTQYCVDINGSKLLGTNLTEITITAQNIQHLTNDIRKLNYMPINSAAIFYLTAYIHIYVFSNYVFVKIRDIVFSLKIVPCEATAEDPDKAKLYLEYIAD